MDNNRPFYMKSLESSSVESPIVEEKEEKDNNRPFYMKEADTSIVSQPSIDEPTALRKAQYGAAQETYLLGDVGRLTYAAFSPKTIQQIERERQQKIFDEFPEFKDGKYDADAAVLGGRALVMVTDPVYLAMPWARAAQAGRAYKGYKKYAAATAATAGLGAAVGGGTTALKKGATGQELTGSDILFGATAGAVLSPVAMGVSAGVSKVAGKVAPKFFGGDKLKEEAVAELLKKNQVKKISSLPEIKRLFKELAAEDNNYLKFILPKQNIIKKINELGLKSDDPKALQTLIKNLSSAEVKLLKEAGVKKAGPNSVARALNKQIKLGIERQAKKEYDYNVAVIEQIHAIGGLKSQIGRALSINLTRPIIGAGMGAGAGVIWADSEDGFQNYVAAGASLGLASRALRSGMLKGIPKNTQIEFSTQLLKNYISNFGRVLEGANRFNLGLATSQSTKLSARGGVVDEFSTMMFPKFDTTVRLDAAGRVIKGEGARLTGYSQNIESSTQKTFQTFVRAIYGKDGVLRNTTLQQQEEALAIVRGAKGTFSKEAQDLAVRIKDFLGSFRTYYNQVGIKESEIIANYFPRKINFAIVNQSKESKLAFLKDMGKVFQNITKNASAKNPIRIGTKADGTPITVTKPLKPAEAKKAAEKYFEGQTASFERQLLDKTASQLTDTKSKSKFILPLSEHINKERILQGSYDDVEKIMEKYLINDVGAVLSDLVRNSVKSVEFARKFGAEGQLLKGYFTRLNDQYKKEFGVKSIDDLSLSAKTKLDGDKEAIVNAVNSFFGRHGRVGSQVERNIIATLSTLGNFTMMDKVTIANLGDLVQPMQNSRWFGSWLQGAYRTSLRARNEKGGAQALAIADDNLARTLMRDMFTGGEQGGYTRYLDLIGQSNEKFFRYIGLEGITSLARRYAFNVGLVDGHKTARALAIKARQNNAKSLDELQNIDRVTLEDIRHLSTLGINSFDDILKIGSFRNLDDALGDDVAKSILNKIGSKTADRDAIIPTVGNRLLFTQTRNPMLRILGQFSSWAQAKSSQTNALIARAESAEQAQLFRMLGALTVYGAIYNLREFARYGEIKTDVETDTDKWLGHALNLSGNLGWLPTSVLNQTVGYGSENVLEFFPGASIINDIGQTTVGAITGDYDKAVRNLYKVIPLPTIRAALDRAGVPFVIYKEPFNYQQQIKRQSASRPGDSLRYNKGGYVKQLVTKLKENK
jgi:hypothetical protein